MVYDIHEKNGETYRLSVRGRFNDGSWFDIDDIIRMFIPDDAEYDCEENLWTIPEGSFNKMIYDFMYYEDKSKEAGVYYELNGFEIVKSKFGRRLNFNNVLSNMNYGLREEVYHVYHPDTDQEFFEIYSRLHEEKFGVPFYPWIDGILSEYDKRQKYQRILANSEGEQ